MVTPHARSSWAKSSAIKTRIGSATSVDLKDLLIGLAQELS